MESCLNIAFSEIENFCEPAYKKNASKAHRILLEESKKTRVIWKPIVKLGCEKRYLISDKGRVFDISTLNYLQENLDKLKVCFLLREFNDSGYVYKRYSRIYLLGFHFKQVPDKVWKEKGKIRVLDIDGNVNGLNLSQIYLVKAAPKNTSLTLRDVQVIRGLEGKLTQTAIANRYEVSHATISKILKKKTWAYEDLDLIKELGSIAA